MNNDNNINSLEEQRRRKADNFRLRIQDDYDDEGESGYSDEPEEISSYSGEDVKDQIARESRRSLKRKMKEEKRELRARNRRNRRIFRIAWLVSVAIVGGAIAMFLITGMNDLLAINRKNPDTVTVTIPKDPTVDSVTEVLAKSGVIGEPNYFKMYATVTKSDQFTQGTYELTKNMDYQAIISNLQGNSRRTDTVRSPTRTNSSSSVRPTSLTMISTSSRASKTHLTVTSSLRVISIPISTSSTRTTTRAA